jgi:2-polyprenyl-3-methyl-5-hydroxy-6-metoxy-1,4-benzoquinol methylase
LQATLRRFGYEVQPIHPRVSPRVGTPGAVPPPLEPVWPLPRREGGPSDDEIRAAFARYPSWQYAYRFEGGLSFDAQHKGQTKPVSDAPERPVQRFRHFMPWVVDAMGGTLRDKRVLDVSCNSGFWSMQCALLGAEVVGFDVRPELIEQANLVKDIVGADNARFQVLDYWDMSPEALGGTFDVVLHLGVLYHLSKPLQALELTKTVARDCVLLDTVVYRSDNAVMKLLWEEPHDIQMAGQAGIAAFPSRRAVDLMLRHIGATSAFEIPRRNDDLPPDYLNGRRASWLFRV